MVSSTTPDTLHVLARRGMGQLFVRQIFTIAVSLVGGVVLARTLSPAEFGTYAIVSFVVNIFMVVGDLGLGAAFIQKQEAPSHKELQTSFTVQFCLITTVVLLTWILAPWIIGFYPTIGQNGIWLARAMSLLLYIPVFRSISVVQLERGMNYRPIAWAEGVGISVYQIVAVSCAINGMGVWSFVLGTFVAGVAGSFILYRSAPWPIRLRFDIDAIKRVVRRGLAFQSASVVDVMSQWATPAIVGTMLGPNAVGYLGLALANAKRPLLPAESVMRVSFPHFSRLQGEIKKLHNTINDYLLGFLWFMVLWAGFLWAAGAPFVELVYSAKWLPAVPALVIFAIALPLDMIIWMMGMVYRAANRNWATLKIFSVRTALNLGLAVLLVPRMGFVGIPWAYLISNAICTILLVVGFAPNFLNRLVRTTWWLVPCAVSGYIFARLSADFLAPAASTAPVWQFVAGTIPFIGTYVLASVILVPREYRSRVFDLVRKIAFSGRRICTVPRRIFSGIRASYSAIPQPQSVGAANEE
jgi:O-antigen/teichoic acid export membrane protein